MDLLAGLKHQLVYANVDDFYLLSRTAMVKDEKNYDKFDRAFSAYFKGLEDLHGLLESLIPDEWLRREFERSLTPEELARFDTVLIDPPRAGLHPKALKRILSLPAERILYISCNPATFARDAQELVRAGYAMSPVHPVDMFPHTRHIELVALFCR